jgi:hypothetical protein
VWEELRASSRHSGAYFESREELTAMSKDPLAGPPLAMAATATLIRPESWRWFRSSSVSNYALTAEAWSRIRELEAGHEVQHSNHGVSRRESFVSCSA